MSKEQAKKTKPDDGITPPQPIPTKPSLDINEAIMKLERKLNSTGALGNQISDNMADAINLFIAIVTFYNQNAQFMKDENTAVKKELTKAYKRIVDLERLLTMNKIALPPPEASITP